MDINEIATNLEKDRNGIWHSSCQTSISYPAEGNDIFFPLEENSFWFNHRNHCILELLGQYPPSGPLFDIGGGNGYVALALEKAGYACVLVEPGGQGVQHAHQRGLTQIINSSIEEAGFNDHVLPAIGLFDVLEHIQDEAGFLAKLGKLLVTSGRLYITVPAYQCLWSVADEHAGHYRRYTLRGLQILMRRSGFEVEYKTYFFLALMMPVFLLRSIPSRFGIRKGMNGKDYQKELLQSRPWQESFVEQLLEPELKYISKRRRVPFGSSCLVAARVVK